MDKELLGAVGLGFSLLAALVHWTALYKARLPVSLFHTVAATLLAISAAFAQLIEGAGPGAWNTVLAAWLGVITLFVALFRGARDCTRFHAAALVLALLALPLWYLSATALTATVLVVVGQLALFYGALRAAPPLHKSWAAAFHGLQALGWTCAVLAIDRVSPATAAYPLAMAGLGLIMVIGLNRHRPSGMRQVYR